jgi:formate/nitrite transporter FocA (FNT family)
MAVDCRTPANTAEKLSKSICVTKVNSSFVKLMILGIFAGVFIGFGAQLATMTGHDMSRYFGVGITKLVMGVVFSVGLILVVIAGAELI